MPKSSPPRLSSLTIAELCTVAAAYEGVVDSLIASCNMPRPDDDAGALLFLQRDIERYAVLWGDAIDELEGRRPRDGRECDQRLTALLRHAVSVGAGIVEVGQLVGRSVMLGYGRSFQA